MVAGRELGAAVAAPTGGGAPAGEIESRDAGGAGEAAGVRELGAAREGRSGVLPNAAGEVESRDAGGAGEAAGGRELGVAREARRGKGRSIVLPNAAASAFLPSGGRVLPNGISSG